MKREGGLLPARPDCWPPTKRPRATPGGLIAASVTCLSRREGVPPCLRTSPPLGGTLGVHRTSWRIPFPRRACTFLVLGFRGAWVSHAPPRVPKQRRPYDAALPPDSGSRLAGSPAWHGLPQCPGCGHWVSYCRVVFVFGSGWRLGAGFVNPVSPGWGLGWVFLGSISGVVPLVSAICGVRGWALVSACFWDVCGFVGAPLAPRRFRFRRAVWACVLGPGLACAQFVLAGLSGCVFFFLRFGFFFSFFFFFWALSSLSLHPLSFGLGWWLSFFFFFFFFFRVPFSLRPLLLAWCCRFWVGGSPVPLRGSPPFFFFFFFLRGGAWPPVVLLAGGWAAVGCFRAFSPSPLLFFFFLRGGLACSSLCLPWAGARTGLYSVLSSGLLSSVAFCVAMFRPHGSGGLCTRWARRPFLLG